MPKSPIGKKLQKLTRQLSDSVDGLSFGDPVTHVYNPLVYAKVSVDAYLQRYATHRPKALLLGMNPGPWGMAQTGIPFGEVALVRDWMELEAKVGQPPVPHPKRPVKGFDCERSEVSGRRLYGWAKDHFGTPDAFFRTMFVWNYCPLVFMEESGKNRTPDKLPANERKPLFEACDASLREIVREVEPEQIIGVGKFAEGCAKRVLKGTDIPIGTVLHPSPASPMANRGWAPQAEKQLAELGVLPGR